MFQMKPFIFFFDKYLSNVSKAERLSSPVKIKNTLKNVNYILNFNILLQKIHLDIKMLYNFVINNMYKIFKLFFFQ